jgi:hypothetical protein
MMAAKKAPERDENCGKAEHSRGCLGVRLPSVGRVPPVAGGGLAVLAAAWNRGDEKRVDRRGKSHARQEDPLEKGGRLSPVALLPSLLGEQDKRSDRKHSYGDRDHTRQQARTARGRLMPPCSSILCSPASQPSYRYQASRSAPLLLSREATIK